MTSNINIKAIVSVALIILAVYAVFQICDPIRLFVQHEITDAMQAVCSDFDDQTDFGSILGNLHDFE